MFGYIADRDKLKLEFIERQVGRWVVRRKMGLGMWQRNNLPRMDEHGK